MNKYRLISPLLRLYVNPQIVAGLVYSGVVWKSSVQKVLVTIDDSPSPETTPAVLDLLEKNGIKAVFFITGANAEKHPSLLDMITAEGHQKGNHGYNHLKTLGMSSREFAEDFLKADEIIYGSEYSGLKLYRPPYGNTRRSHLKFTNESGYRNLMWSLLSLDYLNNIELSKFVIKKFLKSDSVTVFHDNKKSMACITELTEHLTRVINDKKFEYGTPSECLK